MTKGEKFVMIKNLMLPVVRFNVDISYMEVEPDAETHKGKTGEDWGMKEVYFSGLSIEEVRQLSIEIAAHGIECHVRRHQIV